MNTEDINKMLKEYGERTKQKIDLIKPLDHQEEGFTGKITEEVKNKFYKKQEERVKKEEAKQPTPPNEQKKE